MTWRPTPQPPCEPGCTCGLPPDPEPLPVVIPEPELRECGVTGCTNCDPVYRWIEDTDPAPAAEPPDFVRAYNRVDDLARKTPEELQETATAAADMGAQLPPAHLSNIDRIRNATRRNT